MTEWNASEYERISALQAAMAEEALSLLYFVERKASSTLAVDRAGSPPG